MMSMVRTETPVRRTSEPAETFAPSQPLPPLQGPALFVGLPGQAVAGLPYPLHGTPQHLPPFLGWAPPAGFAPWGLPPAHPFLGYPGVGIAPGFAAYAGLPTTQPPVTTQAPLPPAPAIPAAIQDLGREVVATFELPGISAEDLQVVVGNTSVAIHGQRPAANGRAYHGTFALPAEVLPSQAAARLEHGLLVLTLPRRTPTEEPRRVEVQG
jgi:HSP20 family molecular chaperone IbpA